MRQHRPRRRSPIAKTFDIDVSEGSLTLAKFDRRSSDDLDRAESGMSSKAGAENRRIVVRPSVDAEVDSGPSFHIDHHPEFDHLQSKALDTLPARRDERPTRPRHGN